MDNEHVLSDEVMDGAYAALAKGNNWMAYNTIPYFLEKEYVQFFKTKDEADEFCDNNISDADDFKAIHFTSIDDLIKKVPYANGIDSFINNISQVRKLEEELQSLGFSQRILPALEFYINLKQENFKLIQRERNENEKTSYELFFAKESDSGEYNLKGYTATLRIAPEIVNASAKGINSKELDKAMQTIDWSIDHHSYSLVEKYLETTHGEAKLEQIDRICRSVDTLYQGGSNAKDAAEKLMFKHWYGEPWEPNVISLKHLQQQYEWKIISQADTDNLKTKSDIYNELKAKSETDLKIFSDKNSITTKTNFMNEKNFEYLTEQLKRTGFGDTLNDDLRKNIEKQNAEFTLNMHKEYGADKVGATLHFKKSAESDMFFFNKYELELKKENQQDAMKQTFYPDKGITLKEGYNMLDGRAVHKTLTTKEDEKYTAWLQLDFKNTTESGNYKINQYHQNYGFDLDATLSKYPIKELSNEKYKTDLVRSLERGNLQSATFQVNGKEEKIYITPNLAFKTLHAFDEKNQKVSLSNLLEKNKQQQTTKQENKQEISEKPEQKKTNKIKDEAGGAVPKNKRKQKIA